MNCRKLCQNIISVVSVNAKDGLTTITVPSDTVFSSGECYCLGFFLDIPTGTNGNQVNITNGTTTWVIYNDRANYWRPCRGIKSRTLLKVRYYSDPQHFLKEC